MKKILILPLVCGFMFYQKKGDKYCHNALLYNNILNSLYMASLFLVGNINEYTFANAIVAAHIRDLEENGSGLSYIFVIHSPESEAFLSSNTLWKKYLQDNGLYSVCFSYCTIDFHKDSDVKLGVLAQHVERFIKSLPAQERIYVDLTNGSSLYKSVLSNISFILGVKRQFILEISMKKGFMSYDELKSAYIELPDPIGLDTVAKAWLTDVRRYKNKAKEVSEILTMICGTDSINQNELEGDIKNAVSTWFSGLKEADSAALGGSVRYVGRAFEDIIRNIYSMLDDEANKNAKNINLKNMLDHICTKLYKNASVNEPELIENISQFLRFLRNEATHAQLSFDFGCIRARLSTELLFSTVDYFKIIYESKSIMPLQKINVSGRQKIKINGQEGHEYYYGVDGDDTGRELERLFQIDANIDYFKRFSKSIDEAMKAVSKKVIEQPINGKVIFCSGDDLFFSGIYNIEALEELRTLFSRIAKERTCSIGFGKTPKEAYVALKMAKAKMGKNCVMGVEFVTENSL